MAVAEEEAFSKSLEDRMRRLSNDAQDNTAVRQQGNTLTPAPSDSFGSFDSFDDASIQSSLAARAASLSSLDTATSEAESSLDADGILLPTAAMTAQLSGAARHLGILCIVHL